MASSLKAKGANPRPYIYKAKAVLPRPRPRLTEQPQVGIKVYQTFCYLFRF